MALLYLVQMEVLPLSKVYRYMQGTRTTKFKIAVLIVIAMWGASMNSRNVSADENDRSMYQNVNNSPGSENYQAGRDLHVYKGPAKRAVSKQKQQEMIQILQPHAGSKISIDFVGGGETRNFAQQIKNIFLEAGWETGNICLVANASYENVSIRVKQSDNYPARMVIVKKALESAKVNVELFTDKKIDQDAVRVCVGDQN